jgi:arylsulfatase A-like enzyme
VHYFSAHQWDQIDSLASVPGIAERYDAALADDDRSIGELLDGLAARGLSESTVVVLLADHGESVGDHDWRTHGTYLYSELVHVPFSVLVPGMPPRSIVTPVPTQALTPTLLDLFDVERSHDDSLASLVPLMAGVEAPDDGAPRPIVMHDTLQDAVVLGRRFLRITRSENVTELFSLDDLDALHPEDLVAREPAVARRLSRLLVSRLPP